MEFKIAKLTLENFKGSPSELIVRFNDKVSYLVGINGSGKTMIGTALQYLFEGKSFFNNKYRRRIITDGKDRMKVSGEFVHTETGKTFIISQSLTANDNPNLKIEGGAGIAVCLEDILEMIDMLYLRPFEIINRTPIEQAKLLGVDTKQHDIAIKKAKDDLKIPRANLKSIKERIKVYPEGGPEKVEPVNLKELYDERDAINEFNREQTQLQIKLDNKQLDITHSENIIERLERELELERQKIVDTLAIIKTMDIPKEQKSLDDITAKINNADETSKKANAYENYKALLKEQEEADKKYKEYEAKETEAKESKITYIKSCNVPSSVTIDDDGGMQITAFGQTAAYLNEDFFSRGQILKMSIQLCVKKMIANMNENKNIIPLIFIDNAESLDQDKLEFIDNIAEKYKIQFILAYQDNKPKAGKSCILLEEKAIKKYKE